MKTVGQDQAALLVARIERLHISPWHVKACLIMGTATFFDAFDVLALAYVLQVYALMVNPTIAGPSADATRNHALAGPVPSARMGPRGCFCCWA
jgi:hypothetical protein